MKVFKREKVPRVRPVIHALFFFVSDSSLKFCSKFISQSVAAIGFLTFFLEMSYWSPLRHNREIEILKA